MKGAMRWRECRWSPRRNQNTTTEEVDRNGQKAARERDLSLSWKTNLVPLLWLQRPCALPHPSAPLYLSCLTPWLPQGYLQQHSRYTDLIFALWVCIHVYGQVGRERGRRASRMPAFLKELCKPTYAFLERGKKPLPPPPPCRTHPGAAYKSSRGSESFPSS